MWTCENCGATSIDDAKEICFECMTPRPFNEKPIEASKPVENTSKPSIPVVSEQPIIKQPNNPNPSNRGWSALFLILSIIVGIGGCVSSRNDAEVVGGDAYNYIIGAGRGTAVVCVAIVFAIISLILAVYDLTNVIIYYNKSKN